LIIVLSIRHLDIDTIETTESNLVDLTNWPVSGRVVTLNLLTGTTHDHPDALTYIIVDIGDHLIVQRPLLSKASLSSFLSRQGIVWFCLFLLFRSLYTNVPCFYGTLGIGDSTDTNSHQSFYSVSNCNIGSL
ncbi:hypothetical protein LINPERPRIM_LOCUS185, partial [Linum perenne]